LAQVPTISIKNGFKIATRLACYPASSCFLTARNNLNGSHTRHAASRLLPDPHLHHIPRIGELSNVDGYNLGECAGCKR
jgi:hypothetical protein